MNRRSFVGALFAVPFIQPAANAAAKAAKARICRAVTAVVDETHAHESPAVSQKLKAAGNREPGTLTVTIRADVEPFRQQLRALDQQVRAAIEHSVRAGL